MGSVAITNSFQATRNEKNEAQKRNFPKYFYDKINIVIKFSFILLLPIALLTGLLHDEYYQIALSRLKPNESLCSQTCRIRFVESIPDNMTFMAHTHFVSTYSVWNVLINNAQSELLLAAYKTSLRGKHVLDKNYCRMYSNQGGVIHDALLEAGLKRKVRIRIIENYPPKDRGDNEDGISFANTGVIERRSLNPERLFGSGKMHTKFIISDSKDFYLGSANLDWRSLNQKIELGVVVENCPCLAKDLSNIFEDYWKIASNEHSNNRNPESFEQIRQKALFNQQQPLTIFDRDASVDVYVAASPCILNGPERGWDLQAIVDAVDKANRFVYVEVMDYFPLYVYHFPKSYWPTIDNSIRTALLRGVHIKILTSAVHLPEFSLRFLRSLEMLDGIGNDGSIQVKILKVPTSNNLKPIIVRERRMHTKFLITDSVAIVGTSNWSGDYFDGGTTGVALILNQTKVKSQKRRFVKDLQRIFLSHWLSNYTHNVVDYQQECLQTKIGTYCEVEKDPSLFAI